jgi:mono/diheme cytochrome c family protein
LIVIVIAFGLLIQVIPYGRNHANPAVIAEPAWDSPQTRALAARACFDCHSNQTVWPWYTNVAPVSWLIQNDVDEGRQRLNFSTWGNGRPVEMNELVRVIERGSMPPAQYTIIHPNAVLSATEKQQLIQGLQNTIK